MKEFFKEYKRLTLEIIDSVKNDEPAEGIMDERGELIKSINTLGYLGEELKKVYLEEELDKLDKELEYVLKKKMNDIKEEMENIKRLRSANKGYASSNRQGSFYSRMV